MTSITRKIVMFLGAVVLFFAYVWFPVATHGSWNAPDEVAAAYFSQHIPLFGGEYNLDAVYSHELGGLVHPRSSVVVNDQLVPSMWLGLPWLLGVVSIVTGFDTNLAQLVVPLLSVLAVFAWYSIVFQYTGDRKLALFTMVALAVHPGWWYFTARGLHPNIVFVSMLIFSLYFFYIALHKQFTKRPDLWREAMMFCGGFTAGMAIFIRTNEAIWVMPILLFTLWRNRKMFTRELAVAIVGFLVPIAIMFQLNAAIYGSGLINGYNVAVDEVPVELATEIIDITTQDDTLPMGLSVIFPFGIHEMNIFNNFMNFHILFFALWTFFALYGVYLLLLRWHTFEKEDVKGSGILAVVFAFIVLYLIVLYGSWNFNDNPDPNAVTIGTSYIRYWLPITVMMTPFIGYAFTTGFALKRMSDKYDWYRIALQALWVGSLVLVGYRITMFGTDEGLMYVEHNLEGYANEKTVVLGLTHENDIVIVDHADKVLFPDRNVVVPLRNETTYAALPLILDTVEKNDASLYYYGMTLPEKDVVYLKANRLDPFGLAIEIVQEVNDNTLYKITR